MKYETTIEQRREHLIELERMSQLMRERFPEVYARIYAAEQNPPDDDDRRDKPRPVGHTRGKAK